MLIGCVNRMCLKHPFFACTPGPKPVQWSVLMGCIYLIIDNLVDTRMHFNSLGTSSKSQGIVRLFNASVRKRYSAYHGYIGVAR